MGSLSRRPVTSPDGGGWVVEASDATTLGDWSATLLTTCAAAGLGTFEAVLRGDAEARRYALEVTGLAAGAVADDGSASVRDVPADAAAALMDAWTAGLDLVLLAAGAGRSIAVRRTGRRRLEVRDAGAPPGVVTLVHAVPAAAGAVTASVTVVSTRRAPGRRSITAAIAAAALLAAIAAAALGSRGQLHVPSLGAPATAESAAIGGAAVDPPPPSGSAIAADPSTGGFLVVGCCDPARPDVQSPASTWEWDGGTSWRHITPATAQPPYLRDSVLLRDAESARFVLHGGDVDAQTWVFDPSTSRWQREDETAQPPAGQAWGADQPPGGGLLRPVVVTSGAGAGEVQTWLRVGPGWRALNVAEPVSYLPPALGADAVHSTVVLVAPSGTGAAPSDTWTFDGSVWSRAQPATPLPSDTATQLTWDPSSQRLIAILPGDSGNPLSGAAGTTQTWAWDGTTWSKLASGGGPGGHGRLLTSSLGVVVFLADTSPGSNPDALTWDGAAWQMHPGGAGLVLHQPAPSAGALLAADGDIVTPGVLPAAADQGAAVEAALRAVAQPTNRDGIEYQRVASISSGLLLQVSSRSPGCVCWVFEILTTALPICPGLELVEREAIVLVDAASNHVVEVHDAAAPPGVTFGSCR